MYILSNITPKNLLPLFSVEFYGYEIIETEKGIHLKNNLFFHYKISFHNRKQEIKVSCFPNLWISILLILLGIIPFLYFLKHTKAKERFMYYEIKRVIRNHQDKEENTEDSLSSSDMQEIYDRELEGIPEDDKERQQAALNRALILIGIEKEKRFGCKHDWVYNSEDGHDYCSKCGEDGGSPWDC